MLMQLIFFTFISTSFCQLSPKIATHSSLCLEKSHALYHGETARNLHTRSLEHYNALKRKDKNSFMLRHIEKEHDVKVEEINFEWDVTGSFAKPLLRQLSEAISLKKKVMKKT